MEQIAREPCPRCGEPAAMAGLVCPHCQGSLAVDVEVQTPVDDPRVRYRTARKISVLATPRLSFLEVEKALAQRGGAVARLVSRQVAREIAAAVEEGGGRATARAPAEQEAPPPAGGESSQARPPALWRRGVRIAIRALSVLAAIWILIVIVFLVRSGRRSGGRLVFGPLTPSEIAERAMNSTVTLRCGPAIGTGFFVTEDLAVTNSHVLCRQGDSLEVLFRDGQKRRGRVFKQDPDLDLAVVRVLNADAKPLPIGDAAELTPGDRVLTVGNPIGFDFTVTQGIVSNTSRVFLGVGYIQIDANINPGNSGGPLLLGETGAVVGIVSLRVEQASGLGLALPINYLYDGPKAQMSIRHPGDSTHWREYLDRVHRADEKRVEEVVSAYSRPGLVRCVVRPDGTLVAIVVRRSETTPPLQRFSFSVRRESEVVCHPTASVEMWTQVASGHPSGVFDSRLLGWLRRNKLDRNLYAAALPFDWAECPAAPSLIGASLFLTDSDPNADRVTIEPGS
jgi:serine protease Do